MSSLNSVFVMGNLTREVELRYTTQGSPVAEISIAVNRKSGEREEVCYLRVIAWGKTAESCSRYLAKGSSVLVEGYLRQDTWEDRQTRQKRSSISIVAERVQFINSPRNESNRVHEPNPANSGHASRQSPSQRTQPQETARQSPPPAPADHQEPPVDDDIPF